MIEGIVTDVLTLLQIVYDTVKGVKTNSATRDVLVARIESLKAIVSTIQTPSLESPVSSALLDIKETVQSISDTIRAHEKRGWAQKALKVSIEASELAHLDQRLSSGQAQLCLAISSDNVSQAIKNAQEVATVFSSKIKTLPTIVTDNFNPYHDRIDRHRDQLLSLVGKLEHMYPSMERYEPPGGRWRPSPAPLDQVPGLGLGGITTLLRLGGSIVSLVQGAKNNREEALAIGRQVQVVLDVTETLNSALMNKRVRRDEVDALMDCLQRCAEVVADQTAKGSVKRAVDVQSDKLRLRDLEKELSECLVKLGIDLQLHQQALGTELMFNITTNVSQLERDVKKASGTTSVKLSKSMERVEEEVRRLQWIVDRAPFYSTSSREKLRDFSEHMSILVNNVDCGAISPDVQPLSVNKGFTAVVAGRIWRELYLAIGRAIHVYDFESGEHQFEVGRHSSAITVLGVSSDESKLASFGQDRVIRVWDVMRRKELASFSPMERCSMLDFTAEPQYHVVAHDYISTQVFSRTVDPSRVYYHGDATFVLSADGSTMALRGTTGIPIITTSSMAVARTVPWDGRPGRIVLSAAGQYMYVRGNSYQAGSIFNLDGGSQISSIPSGGSETDVQFYTDSRTQEVRLIAGTAEGSIKIWNIHSGSVHKELSDSLAEDSPSVKSLSVAENFAFGTLVASLDATGVVRLWDVDTGICLSKLGVGMDYIPSTTKLGGDFVRLSSNGYRLLARRGELTTVCMLHGLANAIAKVRQVTSD